MDALFYRLRRIAESVIDTILPRRERRVRAEQLKPEDVLLSPMQHTVQGCEITTLAEYADIRDLIQSLKYDCSIKSARLLAGALADYLHDDIASRKLFSTKQVLLIAVPLDSGRMRERGYNQVAIVLDALPTPFKDGTLCSIDKSALVRTRPTRAQTKLTRSERLSNVAGAFAISGTASLKGTHAYLIDDVATTGATLVNASNPLVLAGAEVTLLAFARA